MIATKSELKLGLGEPEYCHHRRRVRTSYRSHKTHWHRYVDRSLKYRRIHIQLTQADRALADARAHLTGGMAVVHRFLESLNAS